MPDAPLEAVRAFVRRASDAWGVVFDEATVGRWLAEHVDAALDRIDPGVALACALFHRDPNAERRFEERVAPKVVAALRKLGASSADADEHLQKARTRLLLDGAGERLKTYRGLGTFEAFVTTVAVRSFSDAHPRQTAGADDDALSRLPAAVDLERALARSGQQEHFASAFRSALVGLDARERTLLRLNLVDGASIDELAPMYAVSRATIARWLAAAKQSLQQGTVAELSKRTRLVGAELEGLMASLQSGFDLSLRRLVEEADR